MYILYNIFIFFINICLYNKKNFFYLDNTLYDIIKSTINAIKHENNKNISIFVLISLFIKYKIRNKNKKIPNISPFVFLIIFIKLIILNFIKKYLNYLLIIIIHIIIIKY